MGKKQTMAQHDAPNGLLIAAPGSGSGKTIFTLGLIGALRAKGLDVTAAKTGPDYIDNFINKAARLVVTQCDLEYLIELAQHFAGKASSAPLPPLGQHIAIAKDKAFAFIYQHWLKDWRAAGAQLRFFSLLADEAPEQNADAVFLPGHEFHYSSSNDHKLPPLFEATDANTISLTSMGARHNNVMGSCAHVIDPRTKKDMP